MAIAEAYIAELEHEPANTRKYLERVPDEKFAFKPHEKSMTLQQLASHLSNILQWMAMTIQSDSFDWDPEKDKPWSASNRADLLAMHDKGVAEALKLLRGFPDEKMMQTWRMSVKGKTILEMPRVAVLRAIIFNHMIHHRGQLSVYLRLLDVPLPAIYGPSADEQKM